MTILLLSHISWLNSVVRPSPFTPKTVEEILDAHWTVLFPWLTEKGRSEYMEMKNRQDG